MSKTVTIDRYSGIAECNDCGYRWFINFGKGGRLRRGSGKCWHCAQYDKYQAN